MYIESWSDLPDGARIVEDTYNEIYTVFTRNGKKWIRHTGWQNPRTTKSPSLAERELDFEPQGYMDHGLG